jgi:hypothetical protein
MPTYSIENVTFVTQLHLVPQYTFRIIHENIVLKLIKVCCFNVLLPWLLVTNFDYRY